MSDEFEPICCSCRNCIKIGKITGGRYEIDCKANPNLGGVTRSYCKCRSYERR